MARIRLFTPGSSRAHQFVVQGHWEQSWPASAQNVGAARRAAVRAAVRAGATASVIESVRLAVTEAVSNAVVHGYRDSGEGEFTLVVESGNGALEVSVTDDGCGMQPRMDSPGAGLGLSLIARVSGSLAVASQPGEGTEVRMRFPLGRAEPARA
jgi:serine/threonine-protein kinase RsbW